MQESGLTLTASCLGSGVAMGAGDAAGPLAACWAAGGL